MNENTKQEEKTGAPDVPYIVYESGMTRMERIVRRLWSVTALMTIATVLMAVCIYLHLFPDYGF